MIQFYVWLAIFAVIGYFVATDGSIAEYFLLIMASIKLQFQRWFFMASWHVCHNPRNPIVKWHLDRKYVRMAEELMKEMKEMQEMQEMQVCED